MCMAANRKYATTATANCLNLLETPNDLLLPALSSGLNDLVGANDEHASDSLIPAGRALLNFQLRSRLVASQGL